ncbi:hypothetical protein FOCC_FOCC010997 [Frankliniella occidentalis]|nr:hypothetical protein FOCC_FOCC010997 [Frankliniella occidentalis]
MDISEEIGGYATKRVDKKDKENEAVYRVAVEKKEDIDLWLRDYSKRTFTEWVVKQTFPRADRVAYHKQYLCAFSKKNKIRLEGESYRNYNCTAKLDIKIKKLTKDTKKKDPYLRGQTPFCGVVTVTDIHNHHKNVSSITQFFRPEEKLRAQFETYFQEGTSPAAALSLHESKLLGQPNGLRLLADSHYMPQSTSVYWWHRVFLLLNYGPINSPLETLQQKIEMYKEKGTTVKVLADSPWAVVVATPVMKRAQSLACSSRIIFVDTSASCDSMSTNVTLMLTATKAGAIPIGILLHEAQTTESYERAFSLFKETFPNAFGGKEYPQVFMTDNSVPEKSAIHANWPQSIQLLCAFHVGHAEWLWLQTKYDQKSRQPLMQGFRKIHYSKSCEELEAGIEDLKSMSLDYYEDRVSGLLESKEQWVYLFRNHLQIGGHHTNNYAEASVRILKDVILQRTKAFNAVALFDYISETWDTYLTTKLCRFAYKRNRKPILLYNDLVQRMPAELADKIIVIDEDTYHVPSSVTGEATYEVVASAGSCMCKAGAAGAFCKHQALVHEKFNCMFPNQPLITSADRYLMGLLAMGSECPEKEFFLDPKEPLENLERDLQLINQQEELIQLQMGSDEVLPSNEAPTAPLQNHGSGDENDDGDGEEVFKTFVENWERVEEQQQGI